MEDGETFPVKIGGRSWDIPHLPFRITKRLQPALLEMAGNPIGFSVPAMGEQGLDRFARLAWEAIAFVDKSLTYEAFCELPFAANDLVKAFPSLARASGLLTDEGGEAAPEGGK